MHIAAITFNNWFRYRGEHRIVLEPTVYAVEAKWEGDKDRSNWGGKSSFVESAPFVFFGWHRFKGQGAGSEDEWITRGENEGGVTYELSSGHVIERSRKRGKPTVLTVKHVGLLEGATAIGDAAERLIQELLGLSREDFFSTSFVKQKAMARFVTGDTGDRQKLIVDWCQLARLQKAAKRGSDALNLAIKDREKTAARITALDEAHARYLPAKFGEHEVTSVPELVAAVAAIKTLVGERQGRLDNLRRRREEAIAWEAKARAYADIAGQQGEAQKAQDDAVRVRALVPPAVDTAPAYAAHQAALSDLRSKRALAAGKFDGTCPVGGCPCPITIELNTAGDRNRTAAAKAEQVERAAKAELEQVQRENEQQRQAEREAERAESRARTLKEQAGRQRAEQAVGAKPQPVDEGVLSSASRLCQEASGDLVRAEQALSHLLAMQKDAAAAAKESARLAVEVNELRAACAALGRSGAQRIVAAGAVGAIERGANVGLAQSGVGLVVRMKWDRDGAELTPECEACGLPIKGQATKACPKCGATREKARVPGPFVHLSDVSGAAEDLAGLALQFGARSYVLRRRDSSWSPVFLDEPFGSLDASNREALATHLLAMLRGEWGSSQAFVIAHNPGVLDAMPARIIVRAGPTSSRLEVLR